MEIWDAYNKYYQKLENVELIRGESIPQGMYHLVCDVIVRHIDHTYLIMQRDYHKHYGGLWEATAGGSALKGETPFQAAKRELKEETGITALGLVEVGKEYSDETQAIYYEYLVVTDFPKDQVKLQEGETIAYRWVSKEELLEMFDHNLISKRMSKYIPELRKKNFE